MSRAAVYNLDQVTCALGGVPISGYGQGGAIKIESVEDSIVTIVGTDGEVAFSRKGNALRKITITTMQTSLANIVLTGLYQANMLAPNGILFPVSILDTGGSSLFVSGAAAISKLADQEFSNEAKDREWIIMALETLQVVGNS